MQMGLKGMYQYPAYVSVFFCVFIAINHSHSNCNEQFKCVYNALLLADCNQLIIGGDTRATKTMLSDCFKVGLLPASSCKVEIGLGIAKKFI